MTTHVLKFEDTEVTIFSDQSLTFWSEGATNDGDSMSPLNAKDFAEVVDAWLALPGARERISVSWIAAERLALQLDRTKELEGALRRLLECFFAHVAKGETIECCHAIASDAQHVLDGGVSQIAAKEESPLPSRSKR